MRVLIEYDGGGEQELVIPVAARRKWEAEHNKSVTSAAITGQSGWVDELTHLALVQRHGETRSLDEWIDTVDRLVLLQQPISEVVKAFRAYTAQEIDEVIGLLEAMKVGGNGEASAAVEGPAGPTPGAATPT